MNDVEMAETAMWDARCTALENSLERIREERDELKEASTNLIESYETIKKELEIYKQMVERMRIAMSQGTEL